MYLPVADVVALKTAPDSMFLACTALLSTGSLMESKTVPLMEPEGVAACAKAAIATRPDSQAETENYFAHAAIVYRSHQPTCERLVPFGFEKPLGFDGRHAARA